MIDNLNEKDFGIETQKNTSTYNFDVCMTDTTKNEFLIIQSQIKFNNKTPLLMQKTKLNCNLKIDENSISKMTSKILLPLP